MNDELYKESTDVAINGGMQGFAPDPIELEKDEYFVNLETIETTVRIQPLGNIGKCKERL